MTYNPNEDYCGPKGKRISKLIRPKILGIVCVNYRCYEHDIEYEQGITAADRKRADEKFRDGMYADIRKKLKWWHPLRPLALLIARRRYEAVRVLGRKAFERKDDDLG